MKTLLRTSMALVAVLVGIAAAKAELGKPILIVSIAGYDEQMANIDFFAGLGGQPNASRQLEGMLQMFTRGQGLKGLDKSKPWGLALMSEGEGQQMLAFVPVTSAKELTDTLAVFIGPAEDEGDGILKLSPRGAGRQFYVREQNGWAYVSDEKYAGALPDDPLKLLGGLNSEYDIAARGYLQNISSSKKQQWISTLEMLQSMFAQRDGQISQELQREVQALQLKMLGRCLNDADQVTLGWKLDKAAKNTHVDFSFTAAPGTSLAEGMKGFENTKSDLAGFMNPEFAVKFLTAHTHSPDYTQYSLETMGIYRKAALEIVDKDTDLANDEDRQSVKTALNQLFDVVDATIKTGKTDMGVAVNLAPETFQLAAGVMVADGKQLENAIKNLLKLAEGEREFQENVTVSFDVETHQGIRFHQMKVKVPDADHQKVLGDNLDVYLGVGDKSAYVAAGKDSLKFIKSIIDSSAAQAGKQVLPVEATVSLVSILEFAQSVQPNNRKVAMVVDQAKSLQGKDHILVTVKPISNGVIGRLELQDGVLEAISLMSKSRGSTAEADDSFPKKSF